MTDHKLTGGQLMKQINDAVERHINNSLRQSDMTMVQMWVLLSLRQREAQTCSFKELERKLGVAQSTCAGIVNRLAAKKLVNCFTDPEDKRMKLVCLTPAGEKRCAEEEQNMSDMEQRMFRGLSDEERDTLYTLLSRIYENVK